MTSQRPSKLLKAFWAPVCLLLAAIVLTLTACDNGCEQTRENYPHICFISTSGRQMRSVVIFMQSNDTIPPGLEYTQFDDIKIDINPNSSETRLLIESTYTDYGDSFKVRDTVTVRYMTEPRFLDLSCGCTVTYDLTDVSTTNNLIRRIAVNNPHVFTDSGINLTIEY